MTTTTSNTRVETDSFGPIDVDNKNSFDITEETLKKRRGAV